MNIAVAGIGYVGLSNAILLAQYNEVTAVDISQHRVNLLNQRQSPIVDKEIEHFLANEKLTLRATTDTLAAYRDADYVVIATPTNYDVTTRCFDTSSVEEVIEQVISCNQRATIIIKSTTPVGFTLDARQRYETDRIIFSPEFLREGKALHDNLYPSRIILGDTNLPAKTFAELLLQGAAVDDCPVLFMDSTEAESVKLFANTYLAMRVAYFNELDTYAEVHGLTAENIIDGVGLDPRIGRHYNNPSFGYGGYCLPKDTKQLLATYNDIPNDLIGAIVGANSTRMRHIADRIIAQQPKTVGIYRLAMKMDSDNFRESSIQGVIAHLIDAKLKVIIYEPSYESAEFEGLEVVADLGQFKKSSDIIVANRLTSELDDISDKLYSRDIFGRD